MASSGSSAKASLSMLKTASHSSGAAVVMLKSRVPTGRFYAFPVVLATGLRRGRRSLVTLGSVG
jgi:hypothetical protein